MKNEANVSDVETVRMIESDIKSNKINDFFTRTLIQERTNELHLDLQKKKKTHFTGESPIPKVSTTKFIKHSPCLVQQSQILLLRRQNVTAPKRIGN